jgi:hypothetical protein
MWWNRAPAGDVDALGDLGVLVARQLCAEQPAGLAVAGQAQVQLVGARVVGLVVEEASP